MLDFTLHTSIFHTAKNLASLTHFLLPDAIYRVSTYFTLHIYLEREPPPPGKNDGPLP